MLRFFRINDPYRLIAVLIILIILRAIIGVWGIPFSTQEHKWLMIGERLGDGFQMYKQLYDFTSPLSVIVYKWLDILFGPSRLAHQIVATFWLFFNAATFNLLLVRNRAYKENNYLPALFFILLAFAIPDFMSLSPTLMSSTFVILALNNVFRRIDNEVRDELFLYAGVYLAVGSLFHAPAIIYFFIFLMAFLFFTTPVIRRVLLYFYGFSIPYLITFCYFYWYGNHLYFVSSVFERGILGSPINYLGWGQWWWALMVPAAWALFSFFATMAKGRFTSFESKISQVMFLLLIAGVLLVWADSDRLPTMAYFFIPSISFYLTHYILLIRRRLYQTIVPALLIMSLVSAPFLVYPYLEDSDLVLKPSDKGYSDKKIMIIGDSRSTYQNQKFTGPFLDPELSQMRLDELDYFQTAREVYISITLDPPEIIFDEWGAMPSLNQRFPTLEEMYRKGTEGSYYLRSSN